jgi:hypothetical protein
VQLSDGSTFTVRTTSPQALYKSQKDSRNHVLWQPSEKSLRNVEVDEAGKLAAFRERFGRGWDVAAGPAPVAQDGPAAGSGGSGQHQTQAMDEDVLGDLISGYAAQDPAYRDGGLSAKDQEKHVKGKKRK